MSITITRKVSEPSRKNHTARWTVFLGLKKDTVLGHYFDGVFQFSTDTDFDPLVSFDGKWADVKEQIAAHVASVNECSSAGFQDGFHDLPRRYSDESLATDHRNAYNKSYASGVEYRARQQRELSREFKIGIMWSDGSASNTQLWDVSREEAWAMIDRWMKNDGDGGRRLARGIRPVAAVVTRMHDNDAEVRHYMGASDSTPHAVIRTEITRFLDDSNFGTFVVLARDKGGRWGWAGAHPSRERAEQDAAWLKTVVKAEADVIECTVAAAVEECQRRNA